MSITVLLLNNNQESSLLAKEVLGKDNPDFEFVLSDHPREALRCMTDKEIDVVVSGIEFSPDKASGLEFLEAAGNRGLTIPIIILAGKSREEIAIKALNLGADYYVRKDPVDIKGVYAELAHHIRKLVTERQLRVDLNASEERFKTVFEQGAIGMTIVDKNDNMLEANKALADMLGYDIDELLELNVVDFSYPDDWERDKELHSKALREGETSYQMEKRYLKKDGSIFWGRLTVSIVYDEHSEFKYVISFVEDIDERKRAEQRLVERERKLQAMFQKSLIGMAYVELDGDIREANSVLAEILGYSKKELKGLNVFDLTTPEDEETERELSLKLRNGEIPNYQMKKKFIRKDGTIIVGRLSVSIVRDADGTPQYTIGYLEDITEEYIARQSLRESEARFRAVFEQNAVGIVTGGLDGVISDANDAYAEMTGYNRSELRGMSISELTHPDDIETERKLLKKALEDGSDEFSMEKRYIHRDGQTIWVMLTVSIARNRDGEPLYAMGVAQDITARKQAEEALRESEELFRDIFDSSPTAIELFDTAGNIVQANQAALDMFGVDSLDDLQGFNFFEDPNTPAKAKKALREGKSIRYSTEFSFDMVNELGIYDTNKTGTVYLEAIDTSLRDPSNGEIRGYLSQIIDVTNRVESEKALESSRERYQRLYNNALVGLFRSELGTGKILECNQQAARMIGYTNREEILADGITVNDFYMDSESRKEVKDSLQKKGRKVADIRVKRKDGSDFWGRFFFCAYPEKGFFEAVMIDITEEKRATERIQRQKEELSRFAHHMSHDIKNYLHKIAGNAELWKESGNGEYASRIRELVSELNRLTVHSVELADAGAVIEEPEPVDLERVVVAVAESQLPPSVSFQSENLPTVLGDATKLTQIFQNLFDNALKHGRANHVEVSGNEEGDTLIVEVSNDGKPFPKELESHVFDDTAWLRTTEHGFGLQIVKRVIDAHGWSIRLTNADPTTFQIRIPAEEHISGC